MKPHGLTVIFATLLLNRANQSEAATLYCGKTAPRPFPFLWDVGNAAHTIQDARFKYLMLCQD